MELNAAEALLQLHCGTTMHSPSGIKLEIEAAAKLFLSCIPTQKNPSAAALSTSDMNSIRVKATRHGSISSEDENLETNNQFLTDSPLGYRGNKYHKSTDKYRYLEQANAKRDARQLKKETNQKRAPQRSPFHGYGSIHQPVHLDQRKTIEQGTQTDEVKLYQNTASREIERMDTLIAQLYEKIRTLENQLGARHWHTPTPSVGFLDPDVSTDVLKIQQYNNQNNNYNQKPTKRHSRSSDAANSGAIDMDASDDEWTPEHNKPNKQIVQQMSSTSKVGMVPIGEGYASVPARVLKQIDWSSYTGATRKLLTAVFSRRVLATHSLTGKPSPAFPGKPAKKRLDPEVVNDIVQVVVERCGVPESIVRTSITTKCADESKMYRVRQKNKKKQDSLKVNQENVPPSPYDDDGSSDDTY